MSSVSRIRTSDLIPTHARRMSKKQLQKLTESIKEEGIREPISFTVWHGEKYIVNGHHRMMAARRLGIKEVPGREVMLPHGGYRTVDDLIDTDMR